MRLARCAPMHDEENRHSRRGFLLGVAGATTASALGCRSQTHGVEQGTPSTASPPPSSTKPAANEKTSAASASAAPEQPTATGTVPKRKLGRTGEMVSMIGLGGFHIGSKSLSDDEAVKLIRSAIDNGITFLDNCWDYNGGTSEERMGKALEGGYRKRVFLMTKLDGRTKEAARNQLGQSLERLKTDHIDLVQVHEVIRMTDPDRVFGENGAIEALSEARREGKIRFIGFTGHKDPTIHLTMLETAKKHKFTFDTVQMPLNVMDAQYVSFEKAVLPVLLERQIGVLGMKSMGAGDILKSGVVKPEECLRYSLSLPTSVVITGIDSDKVLAQDLEIARSFQPLSVDEKQALLARAADAAKNGKYELFKTSHKYDGTEANKHWLEEARL
jgi:aryl-alcohol dehydrogenase-like predicted oxidoreductase